MLNVFDMSSGAEDEIEASAAVSKPELTPYEYPALQLGMAVYAPARQAAPVFCMPQHDQDETATSSIH